MMCLPLGGCYGKGAKNLSEGQIPVAGGQFLSKIAAKYHVLMHLFLYGREQIPGPGGRQQGRGGNTRGRGPMPMQNSNNISQKKTTIFVSYVSGGQ